MKNKKGQTQVTIKGIVTPADWDEDGNITAVVISTPFEEEYLVEADGVREELLGLLGTEVIARGIVGTEKHGYKTIAVKQYELLEEDEEPEEDEEEYADDWDLDDETEFEEEEEEFDQNEEQW